MKRLIIIIAILPSIAAAWYDESGYSRYNDDYTQQLEERVQQLEEQRQDMEFRQMTNDMNPNMPPLPMIPNGLCEAGQLCW